MKVKNMRCVMKLVLVLVCVSVAWAVSNEKCDLSLEQQHAVEKAVLEVFSETIKAAEKLDAEALYSYILESDKGPIIQDGMIFLTRQDALNSTEQGFLGLKNYSVKVNQKHVIVICPTVAVMTFNGISTITTSEDQTLSFNFAQTIVFVLKQGKWKILHSHQSTPKTF